MLSQKAVAVKIDSGSVQAVATQDGLFVDDVRGYSPQAIIHLYPEDAVAFAGAVLDGGSIELENGSRCARFDGQGYQLEDIRGYSPRSITYMALEDAITVAKAVLALAEDDGRFDAAIECWENRHEWDEYTGPLMTEPGYQYQTRFGPQWA